MSTVAGVSEILVDVDAKRITVTHEDATLPADIKAAIEKAGFKTE
ncbi:heavy metal-associated domain-containing protein [Armatimonas sp.]